MKSTVSVVVEIAFSILIGLFIFFIFAQALELFIPKDYSVVGENPSALQTVSLQRGVAFFVFGSMGMLGSLFVPQNLRVFVYGLIAGGAFLTIAAFLEFASTDDFSNKLISIAAALIAFAITSFVGVKHFVGRDSTIVDGSHVDTSEGLEHRVAVLERKIDSIREVL